MTDIGCIFCRIIAGEAPADVVLEDEHTIAFLPTGPAARGHTLVVPRTHSADIWEITDDDAAAVMRMARRVAQVLDDRLRPDGMNLTQSNRAAGWQEVFHFHLHVIPRWSGDGYRPPWRNTRPTATEVTRLMADLRAPSRSVVQDP